MIQDHLGRPLRAGQTVVFKIDAITEAEIVEVSSVLHTQQQGDKQVPMRIVTLKFQFGVDPNAQRIFQMYITKEAGQEGAPGGNTGTQA